MDEEERELTKTEGWFRERLNDLIGYGAAAFTLIAGWLISNDSVISLAHEADADKREAGMFLCIFVPILWTIWYALLLKTHSKCPPHPTVIRRLYLHLYALGVGAALVIILMLVVDDTLALFGAR